MIKIDKTESEFLPLLPRFNPAEPVVEKCVILQRATEGESIYIYQCLLIRHISDMQRFGDFLHISPPKNNLNSLHYM
jgi:hypothetical protein